jgi:hypothetical protein
MKLKPMLVSFDKFMSISNDFQQLYIHYQPMYFLSLLVLIQNRMF